MNKKNMMKLMSFILLGAQISEQSLLIASADDLGFEGTTQISAESTFLEMDTSNTELVIDEVYVEAGDVIKEGDALFKITEDSYKEALSYYYAAIIRAENTLTNAELDYEKGVQESQYTLELARASSDQAESKRIRFEEELTDTIEDHEEILSEIDESIETLEAGISDGSYENTSGSGSSGGSEKASGDSSEEGNSIKKDNQNGQEISEKDENTENKEGEDPKKDTETSDTENDSQKDEDTESRIMEKSKEIAVLTASQEDICKTLTEKNNLYNQILSDIYTAANLDVSVLCGAGILLLPQDTTQNISDAALQTPEVSIISNGAVSSQTEAESISEVTGNEDSADANIPQEVLQSNEEESSGTAEIESVVMQESEAVAEEDVSEKADDQDNTAADTDITNAEDSAVDFSETETESSEPDVSVEDSNDDAADTEVNADDSAEIQSLKEQLASAVAEKQQIKEELAQTEKSLEESKTETEKYVTLITQLHSLEEERKELYTRLEEITESLSTAKEELYTLQQNQTEVNDSQKDEEQDSAAEQENKQADMNQDETFTDKSSSEDNTELQDAASGESENDSLAQNASGMEASGSSGGMSSSGMGGSADVQSDSVKTGTASMPESNSMNGQSNESDDTLFGDKYDLTEIENLLEREPSSTEDAESLLEQLEEARETVQEQYDELIRNQEITELEIQYTYDCTILEGKLAEITYQQEMEELEETLQAAKDDLQELEDEKAVLEAMEDGVITANQTGTIASVGYEAGDTLSYETELYSTYVTDIVTVSIEVSQYEIAKLQVGDTVSVMLSGYGSYSGTVSEKSQEADTSKSRTSVNYEVEISLDNSKGRIGSGVAATITTISQNKDAEEGTDQNE